jgi:hypothetical protein
MKANKLMIGDWVFCTYPSINKPVRVAEIRTVSDNELKIVVYDDGIRLVLNETYMDPIPLTPEILEKNEWKHEFDKTDYMVKYDLAVEGKDCWMMWAVKEHNLDIQRQDEKLDMYNLKVQRVCMPCDFVHQLQHALRLCGIEKTIEL